MERKAVLAAYIRKVEHFMRTGKELSK